MAKCINVSWNQKPCYDIMIEKSWDALKDALTSLGINNKKVCIVTESNVGPFYAGALKEAIQQVAAKTIIFEFPAGEKSKNLDMVNELYEVLIKETFDRNDILIALGGGVTGDMTGFAAATYLRGIDFIQIPTSLLSQVDSSVGGKTGVDFKGYKNMVGAFKQPKLVYINIETLLSLPEREFLSGMGEVIKYGFIKDKEFLKWLSENRDAIVNKDMNVLEIMIEKSCQFKRMVVENDFTEKGERAHLNFGHTIGHAIEKCKKFSLLHGECVAIGMNAALELSAKKGKITKEECEDGCRLIESFNLPIETNELLTDQVYNCTLNDKKMDAGIIKFVLLENIGKSYIDRTVTPDEMKSVIDAVLK